MANPSLGTAVLRTRLDNTGLQSGLKDARGETERTFTTLDRRLDATGKKLQRFGTGLTVGLTLPIAAIGVSLTKAASDAEETRAKFETVFRDIGGAAQVAADRLSDSFGTSDRAAQALLANTGDLLTGFGFQQSAALDLSAAVSELAIDLASFTNFQGGAEAASAALTSALLGEREAAKSLGIVITEDVVQAKIEELRLAGELVGATDQQAKAYATLQIAQEQSANAIGDFARTQDSFANQTRILTGNLDDLKVALGEGILPVVTPLVGKLADAAGALSEMDEGTRNTVIAFGGLAAAAGPLAIALGSVARGIVAIRTAAIPLFGPAGLIIGGATVVATLALAFSGRNDSLDKRLDAARDSLGDAGNKETLIGGLRALQGEADGPVARALDDLIERIDSSKTSFEEAKAAADAFFDSATRAEAARLEALEQEAAQLQALLDTYADQDPSGGSFSLGTRDLEAQIARLEEAGNRIFDEAGAAASQPGTEAFERVEAIRQEMEQLRLEAAGVSAAVFSQEDRDRTTARLQEVRAEIASIREDFGIAAPAPLAPPPPPPSPTNPPPPPDDEGRTYPRGDRPFGVLEPGVGRRARGDGGLDEARLIAALESAVLNRPARGDGGLATLVRIANTEELARGIRAMQGDRAAFPTAQREAGELVDELSRQLTARANRGDGGLGLVPRTATDTTGLIRERGDGGLGTLQIRADAERRLAVEADDAARNLNNLATAAAFAGQRFNRDAGALSLDLTRRAERGDGGLGEARAITFEDPLAGPSSLDSRGKFVFSGVGEDISQAGEDFAAQQRDASKEFADQVIGAGNQFVSAIGQFQAGNIGGGVAGLAGGVGSIVDLFAPGVGSAISAIGGLAGGVINLISGGGDDRAEAAREAQQQRARSVPAININFTVNQDNRYEGGPQMPQVEAAIARQARVFMDQFMAQTNIVGRIQALEAQ